MLWKVETGGGIVKVGVGWWRWDGEDGRLAGGGGRMVEVRTNRQGWCVYEVGRCVLGEVRSGGTHGKQKWQKMKAQGSS